MPRAIRSAPRALPGALLLALLAAPLAGQDLTGIWRTDNGERYIVRQVGEEFCWQFTNINVFCGRVYGSLIAGSFLDLPPFQYSGRLVLRIESPDRFIKVYESRKYDATVWTREGKAPGTVVAAPPGSLTPAPGPAPVPGSTPSRPPGAEQPMGGTRAARADVDGGERKWDYRGVGDEFATQKGKYIGFTCPSDDHPEIEWRGTYGIDTYTSDSAVCQAAVHAGVISRAGGKVTVELTDGLPSYLGSKRNGVLSAEYGKWGLSFRFRMETYEYDAGGRPPPVNPPPSSAPKISALDRGTVGWSDTPQPHFGKIGTRIRYTCPAGGTPSPRIWGTDVYTLDSSTCLAAVHAGLIGYAKGGVVVVEIRGAQDSFVGSIRNGVNSNSYSGFPGSFVLVR